MKHWKELLKFEVMEAKTVQKYKGKSLPALMKLATKHFNAYIRKRDEDKPCISCSQYRTLQAGHYYPAGHYPMVRFNEVNVNGECLQCNYFSGDHLVFYRENMTERHGAQAVLDLDMWAKYNMRTPHKWSRIELIDIIETYKKL